MSIHLPTPRFCPQCGQTSLKQRDAKKWACQQCQFSYFHNMASTAGALIIVEQELLLVERAINPKKGCWDLPGGFVEYHESLEQGLQRELEEELGLLITSQQLQYFGSYANQYRYNEVLYHTCDAFFICQLSHKPNLHAKDDVASLQWHSLKKLPFNNIAFSSVNQGLNDLVKNRPQQLTNNSH
ncbi:NUDIX hydrolase [Agarivorans sp. DSG3-1]|uniref:NUDIX hydrolase n=1 Tax=Agarivorans sp. DSG3-1 TaxID=3342249 RepID=UPI00398F66CC